MAESSLYSEGRFPYGDSARQWLARRSPEHFSPQPRRAPSFHTLPLWEGRSASLLRTLGERQKTIRSRAENEAREVGLRTEKQLLERQVRVYKEQVKYLGEKVERLQRTNEQLFKAKSRAQILDREYHRLLRDWEKLRRSDENRGEHQWEGLIEQRGSQTVEHIPMSLQRDWERLRGRQVSSRVIPRVGFKRVSGGFISPVTRRDEPRAGYEQDSLLQSRVTQSNVEAYKSSVVQVNMGRQEELKARNSLLQQQRERLTMNEKQGRRKIQQLMLQKEAWKIRNMEFHQNELNLQEQLKLLRAERQEQTAELVRNKDQGQSALQEKGRLEKALSEMSEKFTKIQAEFREIKKNWDELQARNIQILNEKNNLQTEFKQQQTARKLLEENKQESNRVKARLLEALSEKQIQLVALKIELSKAETGFKRTWALLETEKKERGQLQAKWRMIEGQARRGRRLDVVVDHLWEVKQVEYCNINTILQQLRTLRE